MGIFLFVFCINIINAQIKNPPLTENSFSPNGKYKISVFAKNNWQRPVSYRQLEKFENGKWNILYKEENLHLYRPKLFAVNNKGFVIMFDDFDTSKSPRAVVIYDSFDREVISLGFYDLVSIVGQSENYFLIYALSGMGWWLSEKKITVENNTFSVGSANGKFYFIFDYKDEFKIKWQKNPE